MKTMQQIYKQKEKCIRWSWFFAGGIVTCLIGLIMLLVIIKFKLYNYIQIQ